MPRLNKKLSRIWLRAYFDCESWITCKSHKSRMIGLDCVNDVGINQIKKTLEKLKIKTVVKKRNKRNIFSMFIFGRENLIRFNQKIGFLHPKKAEKLKEVLGDFMVYKWTFPKKDKELKKFIEEIIKKKGKIKKPNGVVRIISNKKENLLRLQKELNRLFGIECRINKRINGIGTVYFELNINKKDMVKKLINHNLLNKQEKEKWLTLRK